MQGRPLLSRGQALLGTGRRFVSNAVRRRLRPDAFIENDTTPHTEILRDGIFAVRHYATLEEPQVTIEDLESLEVRKERLRTPLLLVPPLGVHTWIFDLLPERSFVRYFLARGFDVYLIDWGAPGPEDHHLSLDTYVNRWFPMAVEAVRQDSGKRELSMIGYCMGGLLALMYVAAAEDDDVVNIATIASPFDFHGGAPGKIIGALSKPAMWLHRLASLRLEQFDKQRFHMPGWMLALAFRATNPPGSLLAYLDMVRHLADTDYVTEYMSMGNWFSDMPYYPGGVVQEITEKFAIANQLSRGRLRVGSRRVDFARVRCRLLAFAGDDDRIVDPEAARRVLEILGSEEKQFRLGPGGHAGVFAGSRAPRQVWEPIADWLEARDQATDSPGEGEAG